MESFESRVRAVDWSRYHHAYGSAADVPDLLLAVANADADAKGFEGAVDALWGNVFHQGTRWGVTSKTVPFFLELLSVGPKSLEARDFLISYLHHLALGYPTDQFPDHFPLEDVTRTAAEVEHAGFPQSALDGDVFDGDDEAVSGAQDRFFSMWARDCFVAVERGVPTYLQLVEHENHELALAAMALSSAFPRQRDASAPALWRVSRDANAVGRRGVALVALSRLWLGAAPQEVIEASRVLMDADDGIDGLYAACAEVLGTANPSQIARRRLLASNVSGDCPFTGTVASLVSLCVERAPPPDAAEASTHLAALLKNTKGLAKLGILSRLLAVAFPDGLGSEVSSMQREAVRAIVDHAMWLDGTEFANQNQILRGANLPTGREQLRALLK
jgi:hypothetical protein